MDRHARGVADNSKGIWALIVHELWHREFVDVPLGGGSARGLVAA
jgi:hypothetical protein